MALKKLLLPEPFLPTTTLCLELQKQTREVTNENKGKNERKRGKKGLFNYLKEEGEPEVLDVI